MSDNSTIDKVRTLVAPIIADLHLDLYDLEFRGGTLRVTLDTPVGSAGGVNLDTIALATRLIGRELDHHDPVPGHYMLEVSSPGLERTLRTPAHFQREIGKTVAIRLRDTGAETRRVQGVLVAATDTEATAPPENVVHAIAGDLITAETATYHALHPRGIHWAPVNLACDDHDTSDLGERIPCPGRMWAKVGTEVMPDLVCDHNPEHTVEPGTWERQGWRRRLRQPLHPSGMARLAQRLAR